MEINYDLQLLTFTEPSAAVEQLANLGSRWREIPLQIKSGLPYMSARVTPKPGQSVDVKLLVDTGFRGSLSLTPASHDDLDEPTEYLESIDQGLSGDVTSRVSMSESVALADYQLSGLPIGYALAGGERENGSNGIVGNEVLQQFNLVFDYANERLFLTPNASFGTRINADSIQNYKSVRLNLERFIEKEQFDWRISDVSKLNKRELASEKNYWKKYSKLFTS